MRILARHLGRLTADVLGHTAATRSGWLLVTLLLAFVAVVVAGTAHLLGPFALYPFL